MLPYLPELGSDILNGFKALEAIPYVLPKLFRQFYVTFEVPGQFSSFPSEIPSQIMAIHRGINNKNWRKSSKIAKNLSADSQRELNYYLMRKRGASFLLQDLTKTFADSVAFQLRILASLQRFKSYGARSLKALFVSNQIFFHIWERMRFRLINRSSGI